MTLRSMSTSTPQRPLVNGHTAHRYQTKAPAARPQIQGGAPLLAVTPPRARGQRALLPWADSRAPQSRPSGHWARKAGNGRRRARRAHAASHCNGILAPPIIYLIIFLVTALIGGYIGMVWLTDRERKGYHCGVFRKPNGAPPHCDFR